MAADENADHGKQQNEHHIYFIEFFSLCHKIAESAGRQSADQRHNRIAAELSAENYDISYHLKLSLKSGVFTEKKRLRNADAFFSAQMINTDMQC